MRKIFRLAFFTSLILLGYGQDYLLCNQSLILNQKSVDFIQELSRELYAKTGFSLYVAVIDQMQEEDKLFRNCLKQKFTQSLKQPYGVIFFFKKSKKIDLLIEPCIKKIDSYQIITQYMVPILLQERKLNSSIISASILNGYAQLADEVAEHYQVELQKNIIVDKSGVQDFIHYLLYVMLGFMLLAIVLIYWRKK